jgi:DNA-binding NarL/FixJ family response regulator
MLRGLPNKRIASALNVTEQTVKEHITAILQRLGVSNRIEVITLLHGRALRL